MMVELPRWAEGRGLRADLGPEAAVEGLREAAAWQCGGVQHRLHTCRQDVPAPQPPPHPSPLYAHPIPPPPSLGSAEQVLLIENDINTNPFTPAVHACVPPLPWSVTEADLADSARADLRHLAVCSVDPPGCKDIDDALHVRRLPNGNFELGEGGVLGGSAGGAAAGGAGVAAPRAQVYIRARPSAVCLIWPCCMPQGPRCAAPALLSAVPWQAELSPYPVPGAPRPLCRRAHCRRHKLCAPRHGHG